MSPEELRNAHECLCSEAQQIMVAKNHDYTGDCGSPFANFEGSRVFNVEPEIGVLMRLLDKLKRIETFVRRGTLEVQGESGKDAVIDIINYAVMLGLMTGVVGSEPRIRKPSYPIERFESQIIEDSKI